MAKLQAKRITEALKKAQRVGEVEEQFTIAGCNVVLRSLTNEEYEAVNKVSNELEELEYIDSFKKEHICRSICELNGESLREYDFVEVEVEEPDPRSPGLMVKKTVNLEKPTFVLNYVLATWSREAIDTTFRKFNDVVAKSERAAVEGVEFTIPDETPEEKFRRLVLEAKELEGQVPFELVTRILNEVGYVSKASQEELEAVQDRLAQVAVDMPVEEPVPTLQEALGSIPEPAPKHQPRDIAEPVLARQSRPQLPVDSNQPDPEALMRSRTPLNQVAIPTPTLAVQPPPAMQARPVIPASPGVLRKAREIEQLEGVVNPDLDRPTIEGGTRMTEGIPELSENISRVNPQEAERIFDQLPVAGINPRYRAPNR